MIDGERLSLEQIRAFLKGSEEVGFRASNRKQICEWAQRTLCGQEYSNRPRHDKGLVKRYITKVKGLSRAHISRLINHLGEVGGVSFPAVSLQAVPTTRGAD